MTFDADPQSYREILVIGGGNAGTSVAGRLRRAGVRDIAIIEPRTRHLYQPLLSHVGGGAAKASQLTRPQQEAMPHGVEWIRDAVVSVDPQERTVALRSGRRIGYGQLIVCPGIRRRWDAVPGLREALATPEVASHYDQRLVSKLSHNLGQLRRGTAVFVQPEQPASFAGAAQKPMYLACDYWRATGVLDDIRVVLVVPTPTIFGIPMIDDELERKVAEYGIEVRYSSTLADVDGVGRTVGIRGADGGVERLGYDVLSAVPPQSAPKWIAASGLATSSEPGAFCEVDVRTLQHPRHPQIWSLGDAAATTNEKSGGSLRKQTKVVAENIRAVLGGREPTAEYVGYSVAPFTVSRGTVVFAEFDDQKRQKPTIPGWPGLAREKRFTWVMDRHVLPWVYWHLITKGRA